MNNVNISSGTSQLSASPNLVVVIGGETIPAVPIAEINDTCIAELNDRCAQTPGQVTIDLTQLPWWPDKPRWKIFQLLKTLGDRVVANVNGQTRTNVFAGVLAAMVGMDDKKAHTSSRRAIIEAAAVLFGAELSFPAAGQINDRLKALHPPKVNPQSLAKQI